MGSESDAVRQARVDRHRLREAHKREADLAGAMLESSDRESLAAAALELAIGRPPRRKIDPL